jgi:hypothetical protein
MNRQKVEGFLGKSVDGLLLTDRLNLTGFWIATELYSPERLPLRIIQAIGSDPRDCAGQLRAKGLDPAAYHYEALCEPFERPL